MYKYFKRLIDFIMALILLIIFLIPMIIIAILIKIDSEGPVLFKQERTGLKGKVFNLYKFRSMSVDNDVHDFSKGDQHTRVGNILRKTSLDELPQIINFDGDKINILCEFIMRVDIKKEKEYYRARFINII